MNGIGSSGIVRTGGSDGDGGGGEGDGGLGGGGLGEGGGGDGEGGGGGDGDGGLGGHVMPQTRLASCPQPVPAVHRMWT